MKIAFFSNYLNHHQAPFCNNLSKNEDVDFTFVSFVPVRQERLDLGYEDMNSYPYVLRAYESEDSFKKAEQLAIECDIAIFGGAPISLLQNRVKTNKVTFVYSERMFKKGWYQAFSPRTIKRMKSTHSSFKNRNVFLLCASAFCSADYARFGAYKNKAYKWGYFPEVKRYDDIDALIDQKKSNSILWVGRMIDWKHPEYAIYVAERLKKRGYNFILNMIGNGLLEDKIRKSIIKKRLDDCVCYNGSMTAEQVRHFMELSDIFLFTSNRQEGWGAVLNESMNSGCAVVASSSIGAVPFLLKHEKNGLIFKSGSKKDLYLKTKQLLDNRQKSKSLGTMAYITATEKWNVETASLRFYEFCKSLLSEEAPCMFKEGPLSEAPIIKK